MLKNVVSALSDVAVGDDGDGRGGLEAVEDRAKPCMMARIAVSSTRWCSADNPRSGSRSHREEMREGSSLQMRTRVPRAPTEEAIHAACGMYFPGDGAGGKAQIRNASFHSIPFIPFHSIHSVHWVSIHSIPFHSTNIIILLWRWLGTIG